MWRLASRKHPSGPRRWEDHKILLSGTEISYRAPENNHELIDSRAPLVLRKDIYNPAIFERYFEKNKHEPMGCGLGLKDWVFFGLPIFEGRIGDLKFHPTLAKMPEFSSLFRPLHMECAIERYIYTSPHSSQISGWSRLGWKSLELNGHTWITYGYKGDPGFHNAETVNGSVWHLALSDEIMLIIDFREIIRIKNSRLHETYQKIIKDVMSSFTVKLSEDARSQREAALSKYSDEKFSEHLPPYEFEQYPLVDRDEISTAVGARFDYDEKALEQWSAEVEAELKKQQQEAEKVRQRVLDSHLRFKEQEK
ncbi:hypothetical protein [Hahella ganghwensis]|uniref:hypothetical protein n=1 Tax=Hahella ganghwensis TaxID=286420 RepID=UPI0003603CEB|nr:hypothetical protein [Hahella ganghwensis]